MPTHFRAIFEGQLVRPEATIPKIEQVFASSLSPAIFVVHVTPEVAMQRTLQRFAEEGRGASVQTMATIQGGLPDGLRAVHERFGDKVDLRIFDNRDPDKPQQHTGWDNVDLLRSEGNRDQVERRLRAELERIKAERSLSDEAYRQAVGQAPLRVRRGVAEGDLGRHEADVARRSLSPGDRAKAFLSLTPDQGFKLDPGLSVAYKALQAAELHAKATLTEPGARAAFIESTRKHLGEMLRDGKALLGPTVTPITSKRGIRR